LPEKARQNRNGSNEGIREGLTSAKSATADGKSPLVSVIIPTYNRPTTLVNAINSVLRQTYKNFEIIVVNDAGVNIESILTSLNTNRNIIYVRHNVNRGRSAARNTGINLSRGEYVAYLDDDDVYFPHHIETLLTHLTNNNSEIVYSDAYRVFEQSQGKYNTVSVKDLPYSFDFDHDRILLDNFIPILCVIHKKECLLKSGQFDETMHRLEDWDLWVRLSQHYKFDHIKEITCEFRCRGDEMSVVHGQEDSYAWAILNLLYKYKEFVKNKPRIRNMHKQMVSSQIALLKKSLANILRLDSSILLPISWERNAYPNTSKLLELRDIYTEHADDIDELIALTRQLDASNLKETCCDHQAIRDYDKLHKLDGREVMPFADPLSLRAEDIRALKTKVLELNKEIMHIRTSRGWKLLSKYYRTRDLVMNRRKKLFI